MKKLSISVFALLAIVLAVTSAFTSKKFDSTFALYSVDMDEVSVSGSPLVFSSYSQSLRQDITLPGAQNNPIAETESISTWISSNPFGQNTTSYFCDQTDADDVCLVKVEDDGSTETVLEYIGGDIARY